MTDFRECLLKLHRTKHLHPPYGAYVKLRPKGFVDDCDSNSSVGGFAYDL